MNHNFLKYFFYVFACLIVSATNLQAELSYSDKKRLLAYQASQAESMVIYFAQEIDTNGTIELIVVKEIVIEVVEGRIYKEINGLAAGQYLVSSVLIDEDKVGEDQVVAYQEFLDFTIVADQDNFLLFDFIPSMEVSINVTATAPIGEYTEGQSYSIESNNPNVIVSGESQYQNGGFTFNVLIDFENFGNPLEITITDDQGNINILRYNVNINDLLSDSDAVDLDLMDTNIGNIIVGFLGDVILWEGLDDKASPLGTNSYRVELIGGRIYEIDTSPSENFEPALDETHILVELGTRDIAIGNNGFVFEVQETGDYTISIWDPNEQGGWYFAQIYDFSGDYLPDLTPTEITFHENWSSFENVITAEICNYGSEYTSDIAVRAEFSVDDERLSQWSAGSGKIWPNGGCFTAFALIHEGLENGAHYVNVYVDYNKRIDEFDENNNMLTVDFEFPFIDETSSNPGGGGESIAEITD